MPSVVRKRTAENTSLCCGIHSLQENDGIILKQDPPKIQSDLNRTGKGFEESAAFFVDKKCYCTLKVLCREFGYELFGEIYQSEKMSFLQKIFDSQDNVSSISDDVVDTLFDFRYFVSKAQFEADKLVDLLHSILSDRIGKEEVKLSRIKKQITEQKRFRFGDLRRINALLSHFEYSMRLINESENETGIDLCVFRANHGLVIDDPHFSLSAVVPNSGNLLATTTSLSKNLPTKFLQSRPKLPTLPKIDFLRILNVGQANFIIGQAVQGGWRICFDCGFDIWEMNWVRYSGACGCIARLDNQSTIILSHYDLDHFLAVSFSSSSGQSLVYSKWIIPDPKICIRKYKKGKNARGLVPVSPSTLCLLGFLLLLHRADTYVLGIDILPASIPPFLLMDYATGRSSNDHSIVCAVEVNNHHCLLPGDARYSYWPSRVQSHKVDFLVVPHHGSSLFSKIPTGLFSNGAECFVCCSENNWYRHPSDNHLTALKTANVVPIYRFQLKNGTNLQSYSATGNAIPDTISTPVFGCCWVYR